MKKIKKYMEKIKTRFETNQVSALINGFGYKFIGNRIFTDIGVELK